MSDDSDGGWQRTVTISNTCPWCKLDSGVVMPYRAYLAWKAGAFLQVAWPEGTPDEREMVISGTHPECWNEMFPPEDED